MLSVRQDESRGDADAPRDNVFSPATEPMMAPTRYDIELRGRVPDRVLGPYLVEFSVERSPDRTLISGQVRDPAHLHGILAHLTSVGVELVAVTSDAGEGVAGRGEAPRDSAGPSLG